AVRGWSIGAQSVIMAAVPGGAAGEDGTSAGVDFFRSAPDGIVVVDERGVIVVANDQAAELFGYAPAELPGLPIETLLPERFRSRHVAHRERYASAPTRRPMGLDLQLSGLRRDGEEFDVDISLNHQRTADGALRVLAFVRDVTERHRLHDELRVLADR